MTGFRFQDTRPNDTRAQLGPTSLQTRNGHVDQKPATIVKDRAGGDRRPAQGLDRRSEVRCGDLHGWYGGFTGPRRRGPRRKAVESFFREEVEGFRSVGRAVSAGSSDQRSATYKPSNDPVAVPFGGRRPCDLSLSPCPARPRQCRARTAWSGDRFKFRLDNNGPASLVTWSSLKGPKSALNEHLKRKIAGALTFPSGAANPFRQRW